MDHGRRDEQIAEVASALGIGDVLARKPSQLSGGQRQRVAMGRAIVRRPGLFLMDEPLSNLDSGLRAELRAEISGLVRELGVTCVYVTHDQAEALTMADRVAILRKGVLQDVGTPTQVYGRPATLYVAAFLGSPRMNLLEAQVYVNLDRHVALHLGEQTLYLPWNDLRDRHVAHFHGERIVVGVRAEALMPERSRESVSFSAITTSKLRVGGHSVKSGFAISEIWPTVPLSSRFGTASTRNRSASWPLSRSASRHCSVACNGGRSPAIGPALVITATAGGRFLTRVHRATRLSDALRPVCRHCGRASVLDATAISAAVGESKNARHVVRAVSSNSFQM